MSTRGAGDADAGRLLLPVALEGNDGSVDARIGWMFLPQDPVATGSYAQVLFGAVLPCGYEPTMGGSSARADHELLVRVRARRVAGSTTPCPAGGRPFVDYVSLQRVRLGEYDVHSAAQGDAGAVARVRQRVVAEAEAPAFATRRVRGCAPGDDASCGAAGGVCGAVSVDGVARGVCVPPLDAYAVAGVPCPSGSALVRLQHAGPYPQQPAPSGDTIEACLPRCDGGDAGVVCGPAQRCAPLGLDGARFCVPDAPGAAAPRAAANARPTQFVRRVGARLCEGERVFRAVGVNAFSLQEDTARAALGDAVSGARARGLLDAAVAAGARVVRVAAFNDGARDRVALRPTQSSLGAAGVEGLDRAVRAAGDAGLRVLLVLSNYWDDYGGLRQYARWAGVDARDRARAQVLCSPRVAALVASHGAALASRVNAATGVRYADDPAVLGWEVMNEPRGSHAGRTSAGCVVRFVETVSRAMRAAAPRQLVLVGDEGFDDDGRGYDRRAWESEAPHARVPGPSRGQSFRALAALDTIDAATVHWYPRPWGVGRAHEAEAGARWITEHAAIAQSLGKPLLVEEFGLPLAEGSSPPAEPDPRVEVYRRWLDAAFGSPSVALVAPWGLAPASPGRTRGSSDVYRFDPRGAVGGLLAARAQTLAAREERCPVPG